LSSSQSNTTVKNNDDYSGKNIANQAIEWVIECVYHSFANISLSAQKFMTNLLNPNEDNPISGGTDVIKDTSQLMIMRVQHFRKVSLGARTLAMTSKRSHEIMTMAQLGQASWKLCR
jgi:hypothetical protein